MTARRDRSIVIALLLALVGQGAYAAPVTAMAVARALTHCAMHGHPVTPVESSRCCHVLRRADDPALTPSPSSYASAGGGPSPAIAVSLAPPPALVGTLTPRIVDRFAVGPPLYLQVRTFRL